MNWRRQGLELVGKVASDRSLADVDFGADALYPSRHQNVETWLGCHRQAFEWFGGVVSRVTVDNIECAITKVYCHYTQVQRAYAECAEGYATLINACRGG